MHHGRCVKKWQKIPDSLSAVALHPQTEILISFRGYHQNRKTMQPIQTLRQGFSFFPADWTAKRILLLLLLAVISEYILTDLQTPWLSIEGMRKMAESAEFTGAMVVPGILEGTIWLEADHLADLALTLGLLLGTCAVLIVLGKKQHVRDLFILYHIFLLFWIVYNVLLMVASLWSRQGVPLLHLLDAALIWLFCVFSFGIFYWVIDAEFQGSYPGDCNTNISFLFPQTANKVTGWEHWSPALPDYFFLAFTISTSFGPTDTQVLSKKGKLLVMCQATVSLVIIVTIAAYAISKI
jgi:hypothetical protein